MPEGLSSPTERNVVIESGPDQGKRFLINMMSAFTGDRWARKLAAAASRAAARLPNDVMSAGPGAFAGISIAIFGQIEDSVREELFDELLKCVKIKRGGSAHPSEVLEYDFQDPFTLTRVREEAFDLNVNFIKAAVAQLSPLAAAASFLGGLLTPDTPPPEPST